MCRLGAARRQSIAPMPRLSTASSTDDCTPTKITTVKAATTLAASKTLRDRLCDVAFIIIGGGY